MGFSEETQVAVIVDFVGDIKSESSLSHEVDVYDLSIDSVETVPKVAGGNDFILTALLIGVPLIQQ